MAFADRPSSVRPIPLDQLLPGAPATVLVSGVALDSRRVQPGDLYLGLPGEKTHGARFAAQAIHNGAVAVLTDPQGKLMIAEESVPVITVADPRREMARIAAQVYGYPSDRLGMYAVTGTAGKTSTSFLVAAGLAAAGLRTGTIGTIGFRLDDQPLDLGRSTITTPESPDLQALLAVMVERGAQAIAMEVSSHAMALHRADWIAFDVAGFTNLGHDHLDFHGDQEHYYQAKARLFLSGQVRNAVVNVDDPWGRRLVEEIRADGRAAVYGIGNGADYQVLHTRTDSTGRSRVLAKLRDREVGFEIGMLGDFNVRNALMAAAMLDLSPLELDKALAGLPAAVVPGRMQRIELAAPAPQVVVDFAHTPESIAAALSALPQGRVIAVVGAGGERDQAKRAPMGAAAARYAAEVIVTDDNPRSEDPAVIRAAVLAGARQGTAVVREVGDRRLAIRLALADAGPGDWVAILGKGHEPGQQVATGMIPFDDVTVVGEEWEGLAGVDDE